MTRATFRVVLCTLLVQGCAEHVPEPLPPPRVPRAGYYADVHGSSTADGGPAGAWDLATALAGGHGAVQPGDTIWLREGTYQGAFTVSVSGTAAAAVVIRPFPGERAIIDGRGQSASTLLVRADGATLWGLELTNSDPDRGGPRPDVVANYGSHTRFVNLIIHDGGVAFYTAPEAHDVVVSGCVIFNNGWQGSDRGHGHGLYLKSDIGPVIVRGNVLFNQYGYGIHAYSERGSGRLQGISLLDNVSFDNGTMAAHNVSSNLLVGGDEPADSIEVSGNVTWYAPGVDGLNVQLGRGALLNGSLRFTGNEIVGGSPLLDLAYWGAAAIGANRFVGDGEVQNVHNPDTAGTSWSGNHYQVDPSASAWGFGGVFYPYAVWRLLAGLGLNGDTLVERPAEPEVIVLPSRDERGRAVIAVINWSGAGAVRADVSAVVPAGALIEVRNIQALGDAPVFFGLYDGTPLTLPVAEVRPPVPAGLLSSPAPTTGTAFAVFQLVTVCCTPAVSGRVERATYHR